MEPDHPAGGIVMREPSMKRSAGSFSPSSSPAHDVDPSGVEQFGLVAEEVATIYPDLVVYDENGEPQTVRYHFVNAMLLNEVQRQARRAEARQREIAAQRRDADALQRENAALAAEVRRMSGEARQIDSLTARLVEVEKALGAATEARRMPVRADARPG